MPSLFGVLRVDELKYFIQLRPRNSEQDMFWRRKRNEDQDVSGSNRNLIELPSFDDLEKWVVNVIVKLRLQPGEFTFLPAYGGVLLFVKGEGNTMVTLFRN